MRSQAPDFWDDPKKAEVAMKKLRELKSWVKDYEEVHTAVEDLKVLYDFYKMDEADEDDVMEQYNLTVDLLEKLELKNMLRREEDKLGAILKINAGAGGTESQDWAEMLLRMYLRWAERNGYKATITDRMPGEEAGIKSATVEVKGPYAYGYLRGEKGNHRLVRISPFDSGARRHTSFAKVEVLPILDDDIEIDIHPNDVKIDVFLSGGAGGQNVQKNATAVRLTHLPTGIVVTCQNERSQTQNRETAMKILKARLYQMELEKKQAREAEMRGKFVKPGFGTRIRNYVLHPYQMVKDERTGYETGNANAVLDGNLSPFIDAWLKMQIGKGESVIGPEAT
jgi:peptide chain release factor 2